MAKCNQLTSLPFKRLNTLLHYSDYTQRHTHKQVMPFRQINRCILVTNRVDTFRSRCQRKTKTRTDVYSSNRNITDSIISRHCQYGDRSDKIATINRKQTANIHDVLEKCTMPKLQFLKNYLMFICEIIHHYSYNF